MQNSQTIKAGYFIVLFMMVMFLPVNGFSAVQKASNWLDEPVTVRFQNEPLSKVLEKVSKQTGIAILYDQELANEKVSGNYKDVKASDAITRLFNGKNKSIQVSKDKKVIVVKTFGAKNFIWADTGKGQGNSSQMTLAELDKLHAHQYKEYKERITNDNEIIVGGEGMTRGEVRAMHEQQQKEYMECLSDDNEVLEGGMTRGELRTMHEQQNQEYQARLTKDDEVLEDSSMTRGELRTMHKQQNKKYRDSLSNDSKDLEGNMTRGELISMHEQQKNIFNKNVKDRTMVIE